MRQTDEGPVTGSGGGGICQTMAIIYSKLIIKIDETSDVKDVDKHLTSVLSATTLDLAILESG